MEGIRKKGINSVKPFYVHKQKLMSKGSMRTMNCRIDSLKGDGKNG